MTRANLVITLLETAAIMSNAANAIRIYGGSEKATQHAEELAGAAEMVVDWADELEKEGNVSSTFPADISRDSEKTC